MMQRIALSVLALAVAGESLYLVRLGRAVARLSPPAPTAYAVAPAGAPPAARARPAAAPVFTVGSPPPASSTAAASFVEAMATPEARHKLQEVLAQLKEDRRREKLLRSVDRREKVDRQLQATIGPQLGLNADESRKAQEALWRVVTARRQAMEALESGQKSRAEAKQEIDTASRAAEEAMKAILGDKRLPGYRDLRRQTERAITTG